jgi:vacuolar-type H+-ATPase subunit C/Vma6
VIGFEYGNTRLRAWRSRLLDPFRYQDMLSATSIDQVLAALSDTPYAEDVETALTRYHGLARLDETLRRNLGRTLAMMASFYQGRPRLLVDLLNDRWDLHNLRVLLRLPEGPTRPELLDPLLIPAGRLDEPALRELAALPDPSARLDLLVSWDLPSAEAAHRLLRAARAGSHRSLETLLDLEYASRLDEVLGENQGGAAALLRSGVDTTNLLTALRIRAASADGEPIPEPDDVDYLPGGMIDRSRWPLVASLGQPEQVIAELEQDRLPAGWATAIQAWADDQDLTLLADGLRRANTRAAIALLTRGDPLGFDVPVGYTHAKEVEVRNLRLIGRGIAHGLPSDRVAGMLEEAA